MQRLYQESANAFGIYVGNTLIKNLSKGEWELEPKSNAWAIKIEGNYTYFPSKVFRRLKDGPEENIVPLYLETFNKYSVQPLSLKVFGLY